MPAEEIAAAALAGILVWICIQDFKERSVYLFSFLLLLLAGLAVQYTKCGFGGLFKENCITNIGILLFQFSIIAVYFKVFRKMNILAAIGMGDILFYVCLAPFMSVPVFVTFNISSLFLVIALYLIFREKIGITHNSIPLAGIQAACLIVWQALDLFYADVLGTCYIPGWIIQ